MDLLVASAHANLLDVLVVWIMNASIVHLDTGRFHVDMKIDCVVCATIIHKKQLSRSGNRHESHIQCSHCKVHPCVAPG